MPSLKFLFPASFALAGLLIPVASAQTTEHPIDKVFVDESGTVHVVERGGVHKSVGKAKDQVGAAMVKIAQDGKTAGWTAEYPNCCTSYPIPLVLVIYRNGRIRHRLHDGMMIYDWRFWAHGQRVAFCTGTTHGPSTGHCELHDVESGRTLAKVDPPVGEAAEYKYPRWARGLQK
jgi:hypothetical protein